MAALLLIISFVTPAISFTAVPATSSFVAPTTAQLASSSPALEIAAEGQSVTPGEEFREGSKALLYLAMALAVTNKEEAMKYMFILFELIETTINQCEAFYLVAESVPLLTPSQLAVIRSDIDAGRHNYQAAKAAYENALLDGELTDNEMAIVGALLGTAIDHLFKAYDALYLVIMLFVGDLNNRYAVVMSRLTRAESGIAQLENIGEDVPFLRSKRNLVLQYKNTMVTTYVENIAMGIVVTDNLLMINEYLSLMEGALDELFTTMLILMKKHVRVTDFTAFDVVGWGELKRVFVNRDSTIQSEGSVVNPFAGFPLDNVRLENIFGPRGSVILFGGLQVLPYDIKVVPAGGRQYILVKTVIPGKTEIIVKYTGTLVTGEETPWTQVKPAVAGVPVTFNKGVTVIKGDDISYLTESNYWPLVLPLLLPSATSLTKSIVAKTDGELLPVRHITGTENIEVSFQFITGVRKNIAVTCKDIAVEYDIVESVFVEAENKITHRFSLKNKSAQTYEDVVVYTGLPVPGAGLGNVTMKQGRGAIESVAGEIIVRLSSFMPRISPAEPRAIYYELEIVGVDPASYVVALLRLVKQKYSQLRGLLPELPVEYQIVIGEQLKTVYDKKIAPVEDNYIPSKQLTAAYHILWSAYRDLQEIEETIYAIINGGVAALPQGWVPASVIRTDMLADVANLYFVFNPTAMPLKYEFKKIMPTYLNILLPSFKVLLDGVEVKPTIQDRTIVLGFIIGGNKTRLVSIRGQSILAKSYTPRYGFRQVDNEVLAYSAVPVRMQMGALVVYEPDVVLDTKIRALTRMPGTAEKFDRITITVDNVYSETYSDGIILFANYARKAARDTVRILFWDIAPRCTVDYTKVIFVGDYIGLETKFTVFNESGSYYENVIVYPAIPMSKTTDFSITTGTGASRIHMGEENIALGVKIDSMPAHSSMSYTIEHKTSENLLQSYLSEARARHTTIKTRVEALPLLFHGIFKENLAVAESYLGVAKNKLANRLFGEGINNIVATNKILDIAEIALRDLLNDRLRYDGIEATAWLLMNKLQFLSGILREDRAAQNEVKRSIDTAVLTENKRILAAKDKHAAEDIYGALTDITTSRNNLILALHSAEINLWSFVQPTREGLELDVITYNEVLEWLTQGDGFGIMAVDVAAIRDNISLLKSQLGTVLKYQRIAHLEEVIIYLNAALDTRGIIEELISPFWATVFEGWYQKVRDLISSFKLLREIMIEENIAPVGIEKIGACLKTVGPLMGEVEQLRVTMRYRDGYRKLKDIHNIMVITADEVRQDVYNWLTGWFSGLREEIELTRNVITWTTHTGGAVSARIILDIKAFKSHVEAVPSYDNLVPFVMWLKGTRIEQRRIRENVMATAQEHITTLSGMLNNIKILLESIEKELNRAMSALTRGLPHKVDKPKFDRIETHAKEIMRVPYSAEELGSDRRLKDGATGGILLSYNILSTHIAIGTGTLVDILRWLQGYDNTKEVLSTAVTATIKIKDTLVNRVRWYKTQISFVQDDAKIIIADYAGDPRQEDLRYWYDLSTECVNENELYGGLVYASAIIAMGRKGEIEQRPKPMPVYIIAAIVAAVAAGAVVTIAYITKRRRKVKIPKVEELEGVPVPKKKVKKEFEELEGLEELIEEKPKKQKKILLGLFVRKRKKPPAEEEM